MSAQDFTAMVFHGMALCKMVDDKLKKEVAPTFAEKTDSGIRANEHTLVRPPEDAEENTPVHSQYQPPYIVIVDGPRTGARFPLSDSPNIIGRAPGNAIRLEDQSVSRQHAEVTKGSSGWSLRDLGSKNGTAVNGKAIADAVIIGHKDVIKVGIYQMRLITQTTRLEEEMTLPPELAMSERTVFVASPPDGLTAEVHHRETVEGLRPLKVFAEEKEEEHRLPPSEEKRKFGRRQLMLYGSLALVLVIAGGWLVSRFFFKPHVKGKAPAHVVTKTQPPPADDIAPPPSGEPSSTAPSSSGLVPEGRALQPPPTPQPVVPPVQTIPIFLDFAASPLPAKVTFQGKELGTTPLRVNVELEIGKGYTAEATFVMQEIGQQYVQSINFIVEQGKPVVPILFRAPIGLLKVMDLPRDVEFYLEGKFSYDKFQGQSAKLNQIVLQKPIYIPFGNYVLELKRMRQLGASSPTYVADIIFHRDFSITEDSPSYQLELKDEDLTIFPAKVKSDPTNADVFIDGKMVGKTPYEGNFPIGEHKLTLRKDGYFEHSEDLKVDINTPYLADVKLKTSAAGMHINNARQAMNRAMYQEAINELAEALNSQPALHETALANYLLGTSYLRMNDVNRAIGYFEQARSSDEQRYPAMLGLANSYAIMNRLDQALPLLVEVLLNAQGDDIKRDAHDLFQKISPFRSVIYVYSEPPGATVVVNDKPVPQQTPVILHELPLGSYRLRIEKPGFLPTDLNLSLSVNEFNPVIVRLKPIPQ